MSYLVDVDLLVKGLCGRYLEGLLVLPEADVDAITELPLLIYSVGTGHGTNGPLRKAQVYPVTFTVLAAGTAEASAIANGKAVCDQVTEAVVEKFPRSRVAGVGACAGVGDDVSLFSRTSTAALGAKDIAQFNGAFDLVVQPLP